MRLATRTGLAAFAGATVSLLLIGAAFGRSLSRTLEDRVDAQLEDRAATAPILAAVADRLARSELSTTVEGARVVIDGTTIELGRLPDEPLPPVPLSVLGGEGFSTVSAGDERWRLLTIPVTDVPRVGDAAVVQLASPLGDVDARTVELRRRLGLVGLLAAVGAGLLGYVLGRAATRPLGALRSDAGRFDDTDPATWSVSPSYGSPDVDDVAHALNAGLSRLAVETERRQAALETSRAFAAAATHELRTPLQSALTNVDIARSPLAAAPARDEALEAAHEQLRRMASGLTAVRALADAELADPTWFVPSDLAELVDAVVDEERRRAGVAVELTVVADADAPSGASVPLWRDGVQLAVSNVVRNAVLHGRRGDEPARVTVTVAASTVTVDDDGPGIDAVDRDRVVRRFERGSERPGSGLGLTIADQVARGHGGGVAIGTSPSGGARVELRFGPPPPRDAVTRRGGT